MNRMMRIDSHEDMPNNLQEKVFGNGFDLSLNSTCHRQDSNQ